MSIEGILRHLLRLVPILCERRLELTLVVVDHGSRDQTPLIIERLMRKARPLRFIRRQPGAATSESPVEMGLAICPGPVALVVELRKSSDAVDVLEDISVLLAAHCRLPQPRRVRRKS